MKHTVRAASVQFEHAAGDKQANFEKIRSFLEEAERQKGEMIIFPECCITGYWFLRNLPRSELTALAEPVFEGPSSQELILLSRKYRMTIGAGLVEITDEGTLYNTYVVAIPEGTCSRHRKIHSFISEHISSGSEYTVFDTPHGCRAGILTCYDNNIGENVRITALMGADILIAPHQTGGCKTSSPFAMGLIDPALWENRLMTPVCF